MQTSLAQARRSSPYFSIPRINLATNASTPDDKLDCQRAVLDVPYRYSWEQRKAHELGIRNYAPLREQIEEEEFELFPVIVLLKIYDHPNPAEFDQSEWNKIKRLFQGTDNCRVFSRESEDYVTRSFFDFGILGSIESELAKTLSTAIANKKKTVQPDSSFSLILSSHRRLRRLDDEEEIQRAVASTWILTDENRFAMQQLHQDLLVKVRDQRGNYIAKVGDNKYKFGYSDDSIRSRVATHLRSFISGFWLVFADWCDNPSRAEKFFKRNRHIQIHLRKQQIGRLKHIQTEIIETSAELSEDDLKRIYGECIQKVIEENRYEGRSITEEEGSIQTDSDTPHIVELESENGTEPAEFTEVENAPSEREETPDIPVIPDIPIIPKILEEPEILAPPSTKRKRPWSENVELKKLELQLLRETHHHQLKIRKLEWKEKKWTLKNRAGFDAPVAPAATKRKLDEVYVEVPQPLRKRVKAASILKLHPKNQRVVCRYSSIQDALLSCSESEHAKLQLAIKQSTLYKGYKWKKVDL